MDKTYRNNVAAMFAFCAFAVAASMPMFAAAETEVEKEPVDTESALEILEEARAAVEEAAEAVEADEAEKPDYYDYAEEYLENAEAAYAEEDYEETVKWSKDTLSKVAYVIDGGSGEKKTDHKHKDETEEKHEKETVYSDDKFKDYGKSDDYAELQAQLEEVMQLLIQLLTLQLAQQTAS